MLSKSAEYALRAVMLIAQKSTEKKKMSLKEIAKAIGSPQAYTAKILQQLTTGVGIVQSVRGPNGGFYITDEAKMFPISSILNAIGGCEWLNTCILGLSDCSEKRPCPLHSQYKHIKPKLISMFENRTIADLVKETAKEGIVLSSKKE